MIRLCLQFATAAVLALVLAPGCHVLASDSADGASCGADGDCKSRSCFEGFCAGSTCKLGDDSTCSAGWKCVHSEADPITALFGATGSDACKPLCGSCPANMFCTKEAATTPGGLCQVGKAPLEITVAPVSGVVGQPVELTAVIAPPAGAITQCAWQLGEGSSESRPSATISHVYASGGHLALEVTCTDDGGRTGTASFGADIACQPAGQACNPDLCCAAGSASMACLPDVDPSRHVCRAPRAPVVTVAGPISAPTDTDVTYTVTATGDADVDRVTWHFTDDGSGGSGTTIQHRFQAVASVTVQATVVDKQGQSGVGSLFVKACHARTAGCTRDVDCCPSLTCQGAVGATTCL